ncbi:MAG: hypothetical protein RL347_1761, partial [Actinomycetota bacterium]
TGDGRIDGVAAEAQDRGGGLAGVRRAGGDGPAACGP